jgi:hypothetical protein
VVIDVSQTQWPRTTVTITNTGATTRSLTGGDPMTALLVPTGGTRAVGTYSGAIGGVGLGGQLKPGQSWDVSFVAGAATCDPADGYLVKAGDYELVMTLGDADSGDTLTATPIEFRLPATVR